MVKMESGQKTVVYKYSSHNQIGFTVLTKSLHLSNGLKKFTKTGKDEIW